MAKDRRHQAHQEGPRTEPSPKDPRPGHEVTLTDPVPDRDVPEAVPDTSTVPILIANPEVPDARAAAERMFANEEDLAAEEQAECETRAVHPQEETLALQVSLPVETDPQGVVVASFGSEENISVFASDDMDPDLKRTRHEEDDDERPLTEFRTQ